MIYYKCKENLAEREGTFMNKEDVLAKAKMEGMLGVDEGTKYAKKQGYLFGKMMFVTVFIVIAFFSLITSTEINTGVIAMFVASLTGEIFSKWKMSKQTIFFVLFLIGVVTTLLALIITICDMHGVII